jgi:hypothetical protein
MPGLKTIYARDGTPITDVRAAVVRSSLLNDIGEAVFRIDTRSSKCRRDVLEFGNYIYIQHDSLPDWVGIIDTPRTWSNGFVEVHAFEVPYILQYRLSPLNITISGAPGSKISQLLNFANAQEDTLIREGTIDQSGANTDEIINDSIYSHIKKIRENSNYESLFTPRVDDFGKLTIIMDWLPRVGVETDLEFAQGHNILYGDTPLEESGELINYVEGLSDELDTGVLSAVYKEETPYGLRAVRTVFSEVVDISTLTANANSMVQNKKEPDFSTALTAVNISNTFSNIRLGNIAKYKYTNVGFSDSALGMTRRVRIMGYRFDEAAGTCELFTGKS